MAPIVVLKLGGSAITDKSKDCTPRLTLIHKVATEIAAYNKPLILLHGGGSFAHPYATQDLVRAMFNGEAGLKAVSEIELNLDQLTRIVGVSLMLHQRWFVPIRPMSFMTLREGNVQSWFLNPVALALRRGMIPIIHGDLCIDEQRGFGVVSADRIATLLGQEMPVSQVLFGCDVDGVYRESDPTSIVREVNKSNHSRELKGVKSSTSDATGGMRGKVTEALNLARLGVESFIFNLKDPTNLTRLLAGDRSIGTRFVGWTKKS
jgi:isopentenyl phosphate kinase